MPDIFVYGTLRHEPLLRLIAGGPVETLPARLPGYRIVCAKGADYPMPLADPGAEAEGLFVTVDAPGFARLDWYETAFGYRAGMHEVETRDGPRRAEVWLPEDGAAVPGGPWSLADWAEDFAAPTMMAAAEAMELFGRVPPSHIGAFWHRYTARGHAELRAGAGPAPRVGSGQTADAIEMISNDISHHGYFLTRTCVLRHPTFSGGMSEEMNREVFLAGDAAIVLPYDPVRDRVLVTEQVRMGPLARGARYPWALEPVAGHVDAGEDPATCARREAEEEAGVTLRDLIHVADYYPSPGCETGYFYNYVGICDLPDTAETRKGGLETEGEDIRTHILPFEAAMDLISSGEADNGPLILLLIWLQRERPRLRAMA